VITVVTRATSCRIHGLIRVMKFCSILLALFLLGSPLLTSAQLEEDYFANTYSFLGADEELELSVVEGSILLGYVNTHGVGETDRHLLLAMFFQKGTIKGDQIYFITRPVHGLRYEFKGKIGRGAAKSPAEAGYFEITGTLTSHVSNEEGKVTSSERQITFKSMPSDAPEQAVRQPERTSLL
jgi:hypothetical protein